MGFYIEIDFYPGHWAWYRPYESCDFTKSKLPNLHKIGKYIKEIGENSGKLSTKSGKFGTFT